MSRHVLRVAWIPAFAGMTEVEGASLTTIVMPAKAGIHANLRSWTDAMRAPTLPGAVAAPKSFLIDR